MNGRLVVTLAAATLLFPAISNAATRGGQWQVTPIGGYTTFDEVVAHPDSAQLRLKDAGYFGVRFGYQFTRNLGLEAAGGMFNTSVDGASGQDVDLYHFAGNFIISAPLGNPLDVFLLGGVGSATAAPDVGSEETRSTFEVGAGLRWWLGPNVGLRLEARSISPRGEDKAVHSALVYGAGLVLGFGGAEADADADGVADHKDRCTNTPTGATVDANGCPIDGDGDAIFDGLDQCPDTPQGARVDARGCNVDGDGDGVPDGIDQCANTATGASVDARGCPTDTDSDGVPDGVDKCASTPTGAVVGPDGCPRDGDGDGVPDGLDKCPESIAGVRVNSDGCSVVKAEIENELLDTGTIRISSINFETGKAVIKTESYGTLDDVGAILTKWPDLRFEVGGHSDSRGSAAVNRRISAERATSVRDYLLQKFPNLKSDQFVVKGYGEAKPLVPNTSPENMAKNRRVELVVLNKEVLKRPVQN